VADYQDIPEARRAAGFDKIWARLIALRAAFFGAQRVGWGDPALARMYMQCARRIGELGGTFWTRTRAGMHCILMH
jgi:hypothetical protein